MVNNEKNENQHTYDNGFHPKEVILKENYLNIFQLFILNRDYMITFRQIIKNN